MAAFFVFSRDVFKHLDADAGSILEQEPLRKLWRRGRQLMCFPHDKV